MNILSLAYLGDSVYEVYIRSYLVSLGLKVKEMQEKSIDYVSAKAQCKYLDKMINDNFLTEEEMSIVKRGRNHKSHSNKSTDIVTYKKSTGLESLIGYLKINGNDDRIEEIMKYIVGD
ncbi:MAG: Mini-ribonuclease 3 [Bacilli bacterium]|nr:Mini-ribonuclease 3 [Bacilli bacterium]